MLCAVNAWIIIISFRCFLPLDLYLHHLTSDPRLNWDQALVLAWMMLVVATNMKLWGFGSCCVCVGKKGAALIISGLLSGLSHLVPVAPLAPALIITQLLGQCQENRVECVCVCVVESQTTEHTHFKHYDLLSIHWTRLYKNGGHWPTNSGVPKMFLKSLLKSILWASPKSMSLMRGWGIERFSSMMFSG